jgi:hypothetical protein
MNSLTYRVKKIGRLFWIVDSNSHCYLKGYSTRKEAEQAVENYLHPLREVSNE